MDVLDSVLNVVLNVAVGIVTTPVRRRLLAQKRHVHVVVEVSLTVVPRYERFLKLGVGRMPGSIRPKCETTGEWVCESLNPCTKY